MRTRLSYTQTSGSVHELQSDKCRTWIHTKHTREKKPTILLNYLWLFSRHWLRELERVKKKADTQKRFSKTLKDVVAASMMLITVTWIKFIHRIHTKMYINQTGIGNEKERERKSKRKRKKEWIVHANDVTHTH